MDSQLQPEYERLSQQSEWLASYSIGGKTYGSGFNHDQDVRPGQFFQLVPEARRILELGSCQGGGTFQLARHPGSEIVAVEGRDYNIAKARFVQRLLGITQVAFIEANLETYPLASLGRFDAVYCVGLLYHLPKPWELLTRLQGVSDVIYLNTHYCRASRAARTVDGYEGADWRESGFKDPLSGLSTWSFWPTLNSLSKMLLDAGFIPKILETDTTAPGQSPTARRPRPARGEHVGRRKGRPLARTANGPRSDCRPITAVNSAARSRHDWPSRWPKSAAPIAD